MSVKELDSFVYKFHQLWKAGLTAHLDVDARAGQAWVGLRVQLGQVPGPPHHQVYPSKPSHHHSRGPAYQRRQERRQAARTAEEHLSPTARVSDKNSSDVLPAAEASNPNETEQDEVAEKSEEISDANSAEQAKCEFLCNICDFKSNWANGLNIHMTRKHPHIEQLDGISDDLDNEDIYFKTSQYWKEGKLTSIYQTYLDVLEIIEKSELTDESKDVERAKVLEARKNAFGKDFEFFPPWSSE